MKFAKKIQLWSALAFLASAGTATAAPVVISTLPSWDGTTSIGDFGSSGFSTWGQTVQAPVGTNKLVDFTFMLSDAIQGPVGTYNHVPVTFHAYVSQFNMATRTISAPLYTSNAITVPLSDAIEFHPYTFTPDIEVTPGATYLLWLFADNYTLQIPDDSRLRLGTPGFPNNAYGNGGAADAFPATASFSDALAASWFGGLSQGYDLAFSATFDLAAAVPEPGTLTLLGVGLVAMAGLRRRRTVR